MKTRKQQDFFKDDREVGPGRSAHGGELAKGKRKVTRPFRKNQTNHLVLKSSAAKGRLIMLGPKFRLAIDAIVEKYAERFQITLHEKQNVGNHIHCMASAPRKKLLSNFLRTIAGVIARLVTGAKKGEPFDGRFWDHVIFTRLIVGRRDFRSMQNYLHKNHLEAELGPQARAEYER